MRRVESYRLWLGHAGDLRDPAHILHEGVRAVVDLAVNEPFPVLPRDLTYCRFPLLDGSGNDMKLLRLAILTLMELLKTGIPTIVCCSNGMSRSPAIAAAAIAKCRGDAPDDCLVWIASQVKHDVSPALWNEVVHSLTLM